MRHQEAQKHTMEGRLEQATPPIMGSSSPTDFSSKDSESQDKPPMLKSKRRSRAQSSTSRKSISKSRLSSNHRIPVRRSRTLKRGAGYHALSDGDWPFLIAAYKKGAFDELLQTIRARFELPEVENLTNEEFRALFSEFFNLGEYVVLTAHCHAFKTIEDQVPVGLMELNREAHRMVPRLVWFPWASVRNQIEASIRFLDDKRKDHLILIYDNAKSHPFYVRMAQYGLLKRVGKIDGRLPFWANGDISVLWRTT